MFALAAGVFVSCGDDDEGGGSSKSSVKSAYFEVDGKRTDFKYMYIDVDDGEVYVELYDIDVMYYFEHPDKITKGTKFNGASIDFYCGSGFDGSTNIPTGNIPSYSLGISGDQAYFLFGIELNSDLYYAIEEIDDDEESIEYDGDWSRTSTMKVSKNGSTYTLDCPTLYVEDDNGRRLTGKFYFNGTFGAWPFDDYEDFYGSSKKGIRVVKVDNPEFRQWTKKLRQRAAKMRRAEKQG